MDKRAWLIVVVFCGGCAVTTVTSPEHMVVETLVSGHTFPSEEAIRKLLLGVSREEALALIGRTATVGYELKEGVADEYQSVTAPNPYRSQQITKGKAVYQVDYYLTRINRADGVVSDDELTPLVFESNELVGKGWEFFKGKIKN
jgi:hypothetical protein